MHGKNAPSHWVEDQRGRIENITFGKTTISINTPSQELMDCLGEPDEVQTSRDVNGVVSSVVAYWIEGCYYVFYLDSALPGMIVAIEIDGGF